MLQENAQNNPDFVSQHEPQMNKKYIKVTDEKQHLTYLHTCIYNIFKIFVYMYVCYNDKSQEHVTMTLQIINDYTVILLCYWKYGCYIKEYKKYVKYPYNECYIACPYVTKVNLFDVIYTLKITKFMLD